MGLQKLNRLPKRFRFLPGLVEQQCALDQTENGFGFVVRFQVFVDFPALHGFLQ